MRRRGQGGRDPTVAGGFGGRLTGTAGFSPAVWPHQDGDGYPLLVDRRVRRPQVDLDADERLAWRCEGMAGYKKPSRLAFCDDLPRNSMGKTDEAALRAPYWAGRDRSIGG
jgi:acyl-CoA synthetase (AMP-forming)/AMP-acid ligase II